MVQGRGWLISVGFVIASACGSSGPAVDTHDGTGAWVMCQEFVKDRLKAPASAEFPWASEDRWKHLGDGKYLVNGYVDAQNAFGAKLRTNFVCTVQWQPDGRWKLEDLQLAGR